MPKKKKAVPINMGSEPTVDDLLVKKRDFSRVSADFLRIDVATALTFSGIALETDNVMKKRRNQRAARKAYDTIRRLAKRTELNHDEAEILSSNLARLKSELRTLGEIF